MEDEESEHSWHEGLDGELGKEGALDEVDEDELELDEEGVSEEQLGEDELEYVGEPQDLSISYFWTLGDSHLIAWWRGSLTSNGPFVIIKVGPVHCPL